MKKGDYIGLVDSGGMFGCFKIIDIVGNYIILHYVMLQILDVIVL